jgi:hypothetical protein
VIQPHLGTEELDAAEVWVDFLGGVDAISHPCEANSLAHEAWFFPTEFTIDQAR